MKKTRSRIRDGYFYTATVSGTKGEYGELEIRYRPVLAETVDEVFSHSSDKKAYHAAVRKQMVNAIEEWSEWDDETDAMVPITEEAVATLPQGLFWATWNQLFSVVEDDQKNSSEG